MDDSPWGGKSMRRVSINLKLTHQMFHLNPNLPHNLNLILVSYVIDFRIEWF